MPYILDYAYKPVRAAAILTNSYVAGTVLTDVQEKNQLEIEVQFTKGSLTNAIIKVEFSPDGVTYRQQTFGSISTGVKTLSLGTNLIAASGNYTISIPIKTKNIKISAIGTGTVTSSSMEINAVVGTV